MKHTKKRAILSAVAMLVVSAIALSSATFAWFSAGTQVAVQQVSASIGNNDGSLLISADNSTFDYEVTTDDLLAYTPNIFPMESGSEVTNGGTFTPVSVNPTTGSVVGGSIDGTTHFFTSAAATGGYVKYSFWLKATTAMPNVTITPTFTRGQPFVYAAVVPSTGSTVVLGTAADSYFPVVKTGISKLDVNSNDIYDVPDSPAVGDLGSQVTASGTDTALTVSLAAGVAFKVDVYVWAEGNDADCSGPVSSQVASLSFIIVKG